MTIFSLSSCLDLEPLDSMGDGQMWSSATNFGLFANQFYSWTRDLSSGIEDAPHSDYRSDLICNSSINTYSMGTNTQPESDGNYTNNYTHIYYCNLLLQKAESFSNKEDIKVSMAEAKFFRAYSYFDLLQLYGDVIITTEPLDLDSPEMSQKRNDRSEVVDLIISDLNDAAEGLPETESEEGRLNKYAAYAFLSRVALYEGTWQKFHTNGASTTNNTSRSSELLAIARDAAQKVMDSDKYKLFYNATLGDESYRYMFILEDLTCNPAGLQKSANTEYIFSRRHRYPDQLSMNVTHAMFCNVVWYTQKLADLYLCSNGLPIDNVGANSLFEGNTNPRDEFQNRDNRMQNTFVIYGNTYWQSESAPATTWSLSECMTATNSQICSGTGYQNHKWAQERVYNGPYDATMDWPIIRYAEVLLNYAEAVYELNGSIEDSDLNKSLNLVRQRVNASMPPLTNSFVSSNGLNMRQEIRRERTVELILEGFRIDDLKRWYTASTEMPQDQLGILWRGTWFETNWTGVTYSTNNDGRLIVYSGRTWQEKNYLYPLPSDQLQLNPNLGQNPGWN